MLGRLTAADLVIRAGRIYTMSATQPFQRALAVREGVIVALAETPDGLNELIAAGTRVVDDPALMILPAFNDRHNHLLEATRNATFVPVNRAHTIAEFIAPIRERAAQTPSGRWIQTSNAWHEQQLAERRLPTATDLDQATRQHPVHELVRVPQMPIDEQIAGVEQSCRLFTAAGIGVVRDPVVSPEGMRLSQAAKDAGRLSLRVRPLLLMSPTGSVAQRIAQLDGFAMRSGFGDDWIKVWGLKFVFDGGPEGGALEEPYANDTSFRGHLNWDPEEMFEVMNAGVQRGWRVATHAIGDRAVRVLLDIYERLAAANPTLPPRTLVIEHAFLADREQRRRAIALGVHITVQPALLHVLGASLLKLWGPERTRTIMPCRHGLKKEGICQSVLTIPSDSTSRFAPCGAW
jgi:predicted amidohydrolase YtcJ